MQSSVPFQCIGMLAAELGVGGEEVRDVIRHLILCLRAKAISFSQFISVNGLRLRKGISLKGYIIPPFQ